MTSPSTEDLCALRRPSKDSRATNSGEIYSSGFVRSRVGEGDSQKGVLKGHQELGRHTPLGVDPLSLFHFPMPSSHPSLRVQLPCVVLAAQRSYWLCHTFSNLPVFEGIHYELLPAATEGHTLEPPIPLSPA